MKTVDSEKTTLRSCIDEARKDRVLLTRHGKPVALVMGVEGLDDEQIELGQDRDFWNLIRRRRTEETITRDELERLLPEP